MPSLGGCMLSRTEPGLLPFALVSLLLFASCARRDAAAPRGSPGTLGVRADLSSGLTNNYYVAPAGSDTNPCSAVAPCFTMERVSQLLTPGDTAHFAAGNFSWDGQLVTASGTASARITYLSDVKWGAHISGTGMYRGVPACGIMKNTGAYV